MWHNVGTKLYKKYGGPFHIDNAKVTYKMYYQGCNVGSCVPSTSIASGATILAAITWFLVHDKNHWNQGYQFLSYPHPLAGFSSVYC